MGQSARCLATYGGLSGSGTAQLETDALTFRGDFRLTVPLAQVQRVVQHDGLLEVSFPEGTATFDLGKKAPRWAQKILHPPTLLDKLGIKAGQQAHLLGFAGAGLRQDLIAHGVALDGDGPPDLLFFEASSLDDLEQVQARARRLPPTGALWIVYPKGRQDLREMDVISAGRAAGLYDLKVVRFSETHTALKFVVPVARRPSWP